MPNEHWMGDKLIPKNAAGLINKLLAKTSVDTEVSLLASCTRTCRFTQQSVHQNSKTTDLRTTVRTVSGSRTAVTSTNSLSDHGLLTALNNALGILEISSDAKQEDLLPTGGKKVRIDSRTNAGSEEPRIRSVLRQINDLGSSSGVELAGSIVSTENIRFVRNTRGVDSINAWQNTALRVISIRDGLTGYASELASELKEIDHLSVAKRAIEHAAALPPAPLFKAGSYQVFLEQDAVADMFVTLSAVAFSTKAIDEKRSFVTGKFGKRIIDERFSLIESGGGARTLGPKIDPEGTKKKQVILIERGTASGMVHDARTAKEHGTISTGHALSAANPYGPIPSELKVIYHGTKIKPELRNCFKITRFHYTNVEDEKNLIYTGLTRDGTFYYDKYGNPYRSPELRFTVSLPKVLNSVVGASGPAKTKEGFFDSGSCTAPSLLIRAFHLTGVSAE